MGAQDLNAEPARRRPPCHEPRGRLESQGARGSRQNSQIEVSRTQPRLLVANPLGGASARSSCHRLSVVKRLLFRFNVEALLCLA